jgi:hypothetical protein
VTHPPDHPITRATLNGWSTPAAGPGGRSWRTYNISLDMVVYLDLPHTRFWATRCSAPAAVSPDEIPLEAMFALLAASRGPDAPTTLPAAGGTA